VGGVLTIYIAYPYLQAWIDSIVSYGKRPPITDKVRDECEGYANGKADAEGKTRMGHEWVGWYADCIQYGGVKGLPKP
jgi:hypothetical protein